MSCFYVPCHVVIFSVEVKISDTSIDKYFDETLFQDITNSSDQISKDSSDETIKKMGEKYAEVYEKIMENTPDDKKQEYLNKLDSAFQKAVDTECSKMLNNIAQVYKNQDIQSTFNKESYADIFNSVAHATKEYFLEDSKVDLDLYIEKKVDFDKTQFNSYESFSLVTEFFDTTSKVSDKINNLKDILSTKGSDEIVNSNSLYGKVNDLSKSISKDIDELTELKKSINNSDLKDNVKSEIVDMLDKKLDKLNNFNGKTQKYTELLEKYKKIQKRLKKSTAKRESIQAKLDKANQTKNQRLISMYLKRLEAIDSQTAEIEAEAAQIQSELADLAKDIKDTQM